MSLPGRCLVCPYRTRLEAFRDAETSPEERQRIEAHLTECVACRERLQELQGLARVLNVYETPPGGWSSDAEFWKGLAPQLRPRAIPARPDRAMQPSSFLAPASVVVSSLALRGLAAAALIVSVLYQWRLWPASLSAALASATRLALGPLVWQAGQTLYRALLRSRAPLGIAPVQLSLFAFEAAVSALLLLLSGLHVGWLLRWLRDQPGLQGAETTE